MEESTTLQMATQVPPRRRDSRMAASVSAVSPDWEISSTRVFSSTTGFL